MESLRDIQRKIGAVKKTQQITKAMNMVAAARLRGAQEAMERFKPYASKFGEVLGSLAGRVDPDIHPLLVMPEKIETVALLLITSDRGLCGSYNTNIATTAERWVKDRQKEGKEVALICIGRKGRDYFRRRKYKIAHQFVDQMGNFDYTVAREIAQNLMEMFLAGECQEVYELHAEFVNVAVQRPLLSKLLPFSTAEIGVQTEEEGIEGTMARTDQAMEYVCEPDPEVLMIELLPKNIEVQVFGAILEAVASEHAARMTAMDNAQSNCKEMIENLTLAYNKARQASITNEILEIVSGAEALKGK